MKSTVQFWSDPAMPCAESRRACRSRACYRPHSHPTFSIGAVDDHPNAQRFADRIETVTVDSVLAWLVRNLHAGPEQQVQ